MAEENLTLKESIEKAGNDQNPAPSEESASESTSEEKSGDAEQAEEVVVDPEIDEAVAFYRALRDPNQQKNIIAELAQRAGLIKQPEELTKKDQKTFNDLIGEILGEEYPDLKDKMTKLFDVYDAHHNEELNKVKEQLANQRVQQQVETFESEFSNFIKEHKVTDAIAAKMLKEIEELPPTIQSGGKRIPLTTYLRKIHSLVTLNSGNSSDRTIQDAAKRNEKIERNLKDRPKNLASDIDDERLKRGSKLPSVREAIAAAAKGVTLDD